MIEETSRTFQGAIEKSTSWKEIHFSEEAAIALIAHCHRVLRAPKDHPTLVELWNNYVDMQPSLRERLQNNDWSQTEGKALVLMSHLSLNMRAGIRNFLPQSVSSTLSEEDKQALWAWYLLNQGILNDPENPYCLLYPSALLFMAGPYASVEIYKRAAKHPVGFAAGYALYNWNSKADGVEQSVIAAIKRISGSARKHIPAAMRPRGNNGKTATGVSDYKFGPLDDQVVLTLLKDFSSASPDEIVARSLDGLLNIIPKAVALDVLDRGKSPQSNLERSIGVESDLDCGDQIDDALNKLFPSDNPEDVFASNDLMSKLAKAHPRQLRLLFAVQDRGLSFKQIGKMTGEKHETVKKQYHRARVTVRKWLEEH